MHDYSFGIIINTEYSRQVHQSSTEEEIFKTDKAIAFLQIESPKRVSIISPG